MRMPKKTRRRYTEQQRAAILADMRRNGLTEVAAAKKHGVSAMTIWTWNRAAKGRRSTRRTRVRRAGNGLDGLLRSEVRDRIRELLPEVVREEVASYIHQVLGTHARGTRS